MSEKRFTVDDDGIYDNQEKKHFKFIAYDWIDCDIYECCEMLNEQQATINEQNEAIEYLKTVIRYTLPNQMVADVFKEIGEEYE